MLNTFRNTLFNKLTLRNYTFYNMLGIYLVEGLSSSCRFKFLQAPLYSLCSSSTVKRFICNNSEEVNELQGAFDTSEKNELITNDYVFYDENDHSSQTLINKEQKNKKNILKEENLELFKEIANGDSKVYSLLKNLQVRLDVTSSQYGIKVGMKKDEWVEFLNSSPSKRKTYVAYLILNTMRTIKRNYQNIIPLYDLPTSDEDEQENMSANFDDVQCYHLFHNSMFLKLRTSAMKRTYYNKGFTAMMHSSRLMFDCSYNDHMSRFELKELAKQLIASATINFKSEEPFNIIFCNFNKNTYLGNMLEKFNPVIYTDEYPLTVTEKSFIDFIPKSDLVYLTPHCKTTLKSFDPDKTYIIGAYVDKSQKKPLSLAKAKELNISMAKFPIDQFLDWGLGNKCLSLPHVTKIMIDLKINDGNWTKAFDIIPKRFLCKTRPKNKTKATFELEIMNIFQSLEVLE